MTVYVSKDGNRFFNVENDIDFSYWQLQDLENDGFEFLAPNYPNDKSMQSLISIIDSLSLKQRLKITNNLLTSWHQEPISVQKEFEKYFKEHCDDEDYSQADFLAEFAYGDEGILDGMRGIYSQISSSYYDIKLILDFLDQTLSSKHWKSWLLFGNSQGEICFAWNYHPKYENSFNDKFDDDGKGTYFGEAWQNVLENIIYKNFISITECDNEGNNVDELFRNVAGYYVPAEGQLTNSSNQYVDEYMLQMYNAIPANIFVKINYSLPVNEKVANKIIK